MATPQDLLNANANLATLDAVVTSEAETVPDRLGQQKLTLSGFEDRANAAIESTGWFVVGEFSAGFAYTARNQVGRDSSGNMWSYNGPFTAGSFVVAAGTVPSAPNYTNRGDAALRSEISQVASVKQLRRVSGITQSIESFVSGTGFGAGDFIYYPAMSETLHNGGTIIAEGARLAWNGTQADLSTLLNYSGTGNGCHVRQNVDEIDVDMFGAVANSTTHAVGNSLAINKSIQALKSDSTHVIKKGTYYVLSFINVNKGFACLQWYGRLQPLTGFSDDYLVEFHPEANFDYYRTPILIDKMFLYCNGISRGLYAEGMDHFDWSKCRIEGAYGSGMELDRIREGSIYSPQFINCLQRERFASPSDWNSATAYIVGQYARVKDPDWLPANPYTAGNTVRDSGLRYIALESSTGQQPSVAPLFWKEIPHEDYKCVIANTNKNPQSNNTNSTLEANRVWQKVYQDEACFEILDIELAGDRSNQINLFAPIIRDSGNKCYLRVDSSKLPARPVTHFNIWGGHIHGQPIAQSGGPIPIPNLQRMIELGYVANINIDGTNIRCGDGERCIGLMIGDGGTTKVSQNIRVAKSSVSGDGERCAGVVVMPSTQASFDSQLDAAFVVTAATSTDLFDPRRIFRRNYKNEQRCLLPSGLTVTPGGFTVVGRAEYSTVRPYSYTIDGEPQPRFDVQFTSSATQFRFGDGTASPDVLFGRVTADTLSLASGASLQVAGGRWNTGQLVVNVRRIWLDTLAYLRVKSSAPTSEKDGAVIQTSRYSSTAGRPILSSDANDIGIMHYDVTLDKPIWWNGSVWKDAAGATV